MNEYENNRRPYSSKVVDGDDRAPSRAMLYAVGFEKEDFEKLMTGIPANNHFAMDYLFTEILSRQTPATQEYLLKNSILDRFCAPLCDAVCETNGSATSHEIVGQEFLNLMIESNLFVIPLDHENMWFRYHHLFQDLLKRTLIERLKPNEIAGLHTKASIWYAQPKILENDSPTILASSEEAP